MGLNFENMGILTDEERGEKALADLSKANPDAAASLKRLKELIEAKRNQAHAEEPFVITPQMRAEAKGREKEMRARLGDDF